MYFCVSINETTIKQLLRASFDGARLKKSKWERSGEVEAEREIERARAEDGGRKAVGSVLRPTLRTPRVY